MRNKLVNCSQFIRKITYDNTQFVVAVFLVCLFVFAVRVTCEETSSTIAKPAMNFF